MLDSYFKQSPDKKEGNQKLDLSKIKRSKNETSIDEDNQEEENFIVEHPKREMNFKPTQEPSINWNASPNKDIYEKVPPL